MKKVEDKLSFENAATYYHLATVFNLYPLEVIFDYIERHFTTVAESKNFLQLNFKVVKKILSSSKLYITSELEVLKAFEKWTASDCVNRIKRAKALLPCVRLPLLSIPALKGILPPENLSDVFRGNQECIDLVNAVIQKKEEVNGPEACLQCETRYCDQSRYTVFKKKSIIQFNKFVQIGGKNIKKAHSIANTF